MIYVIDNGGDYSDQTTYFVSSKLNAEQMVVLTKLIHQSGRIVGYAKKFEWYDSNDAMSLLDFLEQAYTYSVENSILKLTEATKDFPDWFIKMRDAESKRQLKAHKESKSKVPVWDADFIKKIKGNLKDV